MLNGLYYNFWQVRRRLDDRHRETRRGVSRAPPRRPSYRPHPAQPRSPSRWQDETHVRGIWRRCSLDEYRKDDPAWEVVLDVDALGADEGISWVRRGPATKT